MGLTEEEKEIIWKAMDTDRSGSVSRGEFVSFWVREDEEEDIGKWDASDTERLRGHIQRYVSKRPRMTYDKLFDTVDTDGSNMISFDEFADMLDGIQLGFTNSEARYAPPPC